MMEEDGHKLAAEFNQQNNRAAPQPANDVTPPADLPVLFLSAVENGKYDDAARMIGMGVNVNAQNAQRKSALAFAVDNHDRHMVKLLIKSGADVAKYETETGGTLLGRLADAKTDFSVPEESIAVMLMDSGAKAQAYDRNGLPVLIRYASMGMDRALDTALQAGADPNTLNPTTQLSPLYYAISGGKLSIVEKLLAAGANPNGAPQEKTAPMVAALRSGKNIDILDALIRAGGDLNKPTGGFNETPFMVALQTGQKALIEAMILRGADVNAIMPNGKPVLQNAVANGVDDDSIGLLLQKGANPNDFSTDTGTALHAAVKSRRPAVVNLLLQHQADPLRTNAEGTTPLQFAITALGREHPIVDRLNIADGAARIAQEQTKKQQPPPPYFYGH
jgi:ankyrin repeat protein